MKDQSKKISRIISELSTYYLEKNPTNLTICVDNLDDHFKITFKVHDVECSQAENERILEILNEPRQPATEAYYWTLSGESSRDSELSLIGMMIDEAEMSCDGSCLLVELYRYK